MFGQDSYVLKIDKDYDGVFHVVKKILRKKIARYKNNLWVNVWFLMEKKNILLT